MRKAVVIAVLAAAVIVLCNGQAGAGESRYSYSVTPYVGYHYYDNVRDLKDHPEAGLRVEKFLTDVWSVELGIGDVFTKERATGKSRDDLTYSLDLTYNLFLNTRKFAPYLTAGLGGDYIDNLGHNGPNVGLGARWLITENFALRPEARYIDLFTKRDEFLVLLGLNFLFGEKPKPAPKTAPVEQPPARSQEQDSDHDGVADSLDKCPDTPNGVAVDKNGCPLDSDGDGVPDYLDTCPDTPKGVAVDKNGCAPDKDGDGVPDYMDTCPDTPKGVTVNKSGCPLDVDGDGVPDYMDKCPDTPKGATVDKNGCPQDSDGDGVPDYLDKCPDTPKGAKVDAGGCPVKLTEKVSINLAIEFDSGKADIKPQYDEQIKKVADFMRSYPDTSAVIEGYTDNVGKEASNVRLSTKRAESVRAELIEKFGIAANRLSVKGYGSARPVADNATPEGRQKNRRIEAVIEATVTH